MRGSYNVFLKYKLTSDGQIRIMIRLKSITSDDLIWVHVDSIWKGVIRFGFDSSLSRFDLWFK